MSERSVTFLNRFYWPDVAATGQMLTDLAEDLAGRGWDVTVITSRSAYATTHSLPRRETRNGVRVVRVASSRLGRSTTFGRLADYASYVAGAAMALRSLPRRGIVVGMSDPPLLAALAVAAARVRGARSVYWVQDLFPDLAVELSVMRRGGIAHRVFSRLAAMTHQHADLVVALGPGMARVLEARGTSASRLRVVHNWADAGDIRPVARDANPFVRRHGLEDRFIVLYAGNAGRAHTFDAVCGAMRRLRDRDEIAFVFVGGGYRTAELKAFAERESLGNVRFLDYVPREELRYSLAAADVSLVTEDPRVAGLLVPSKAYGILASGRPMLFVGDRRSDVARLVQEHDCGVVIDPDDAEGLAAAIERLRADSGARGAMGRRGREAAERLYDRSHGVNDWNLLLESVNKT